MKIILSLVSILIITATGFSQASQRSQSFNVEKSGLAIQGYDPVAYFSNKAIKGKKELAVAFEGLIYYFSTPENKEAFKKEPAKYEPQYCGWCAYAMGSSGEKVEIDPETFKIKNGKLFLFYNKYFNNTLKSWNKDEVNLENKANSNWQKFFPHS